MSIPTFPEREMLSKVWNSGDTIIREGMSKEVEGLREWYLLERSRSQPAYLKLYKLYNAISVEPEDLIEETAFKWIDEELQTHKSNSLSSIPSIYVFAIPHQSI
jgi:hypothetical protein